VLITGQAQLVMQKIALLGTLSPLILFSLKVLPFVVIWVLFTFIYIFMPNTKVYLKSGVIGGIIGGTLYQIVQWMYLTFQVGVAQYNAIYGSFAALPLFLVWLQMSWLIVLFGAEISFARQNLETYEFEPDCLRVSAHFKKLLTLRIAQAVVKNFCSGIKPWIATKISHELEIPIRLVNQIVYELVEAGIFSETKEAHGATGYQPARSVEQMTIQSILEILARQGTDAIPVTQSEGLRKIAASLDAFDKILEKSSVNMRLVDIP
jgi:membrane protein